MKKIVILGSTGSIGGNALELIRAFPEKFECVALGAGKNLEKLREQILEFRPRVVAVSQPDLVRSLQSEFPALKVLLGEPGMCALAELSEADIVVMGIVGFAALAPTLSAIRAKKTVALANKETLVVGGSLLKREVERTGAKVIPVDSEHNGLYQLLEGRRREDIASVVITASGGPLLRLPELPLDDVTPELAVRHPNWKMGPKISVDSATLMNKGLELIEAHYLFEFPPSLIEVWVHPQSLVHAALWMIDNSCLAQLTVPDMKSSIGFAMAYPDRLNAPVSKLSFREMAKLEFFEPDNRRFPALMLARQALESGPSHVIALNAANEIAVELFLNGKLLFSQITAVIAQVLESHRPCSIGELGTVWGLDADARRKAGEVAGSFAKH